MGSEILVPLADTPLRTARFVRREKRFIVHAQMNGKPVVAHLADPGRLVGLLETGAELWLSGPYPPPRKLAWSVRAVRAPNGTPVSLVSTLANRCVAAIAPRLPDFPADIPMREHREQNHRFDLAWNGGAHLGEVKTVSHRDPDGVGRWPDAPSDRGIRHISALTEVARSGRRATVIFATGRGDIDRVEPFNAVDPRIGPALREAIDAGVEIKALRFLVTTDGVQFDAPIPFRLT